MVHLQKMRKVDLRIEIIDVFENLTGFGVGIAELLESYPYLSVSFNIRELIRQSSLVNLNLKLILPKYLLITYFDVTKCD